MTRLAIALVVCVAVLSFAGGMIVHAIIYHPASVPCPTEDSCSVDYHGGAWHIVPGRPL